MTETLRERVRERLVELAREHIYDDHLCGASGHDDLADAILREFRVQPVAVGKVTGEGEVEGL